MKPLRYRPVNWVDGMQLSSEHFIASDRHQQDLVRDALSLGSGGVNYGLLPPFAGQRSAYAIELREKAANVLEVRVPVCNAITADGYRIDIDSTADAGAALSYSHYFKELPAAGSSLYNVILRVDPFERVPAGNLDPQDDPPRYPHINKGYRLFILPAGEQGPGAADEGILTIGQLILSPGRLSINERFIPASTAMGSHPALMQYYDKFSTMLNSLQLAAFSIADKTAGAESVSILGKNIRLVSEKMLDYFAHTIFSFRNPGYQQAPVQVAGYCCQLAHVFFTGMRMIGAREREDVLKYFYEWKDVTPANFEELMSRTMELRYDHQDIYPSMALIDEFVTVITALWQRLGALEYIGQHKENIVVAEQQVVQQVQTKKTWILLD